MKQILLLAVIATAVIFGASCGHNQTQEEAPQSTLVDSNGTLMPLDDQYWAKNNFDLQRVGDIVRRSRTPEEFERNLNRTNGIDNLDLNGDGYADYISVREYNDLNNPSCRGLSMYTQYGPDQIQELGDVLFYRDQPQYPGARILLRGDPRIYGDNFYYHNNWLDQSIQLVSYLFGGDRDLYSTPYYYDNYPTWYQTYDVVETPVYQQRVVELYPQPVVVYTAQPENINRINISSPIDGRYYSQAQAVFVNPAPEQREFIKKNPRPDHMLKANNGRGPRTEKPENGRPDRAESRRQPEQPNAQPNERKPGNGSPRGERTKIARNEKPGRGNHKAGNPAPPRPASAGKPVKSPDRGGKNGNPGNHGNGADHGNSGKHGNGGNKGGKPGGGNKGGGKKH